MELFSDPSGKSSVTLSKPKENFNFLEIDVVSYTKSTKTVDWVMSGVLPVGGDLKSNSFSINNPNVGGGIEMTISGNIITLEKNDNLIIRVLGIR